MPDCTADRPQITRQSPAIPGESPGVARESGQAPHRWEITCTEFTPAARPGDVLGFARLMLPGGMLLNDLRIVRLADGSIGVVLPRRAVLARRQPVRRPDGEFMTIVPVDFPRRDDWARFNAAALAAVRAAFPDTLPHSHPTTTTPPSATLAPAA